MASNTRPLIRARCVIQPWIPLHQWHRKAGLTSCSGRFGPICRALGLRRATEGGVSSASAAFRRLKLRLPAFRASRQADAGFAAVSLELPPDWCGIFPVPSGARNSIFWTGAWPRGKEKHRPSSRAMPSAALICRSVAGAMGGRCLTRSCAPVQDLLIGLALRLWLSESAYRDQCSKSDLGGHHSLTHDRLGLARCSIWVRRRRLRDAALSELGAMPNQDARAWSRSESSRMDVDDSGDWEHRSHRARGMAPSRGCAGICPVPEKVVRAVWAAFTK